MSKQDCCSPMGQKSEEAQFLRNEINRLKKEKNAIIMAHYYQRDEVQEIADRIGDSLALAQMAAETYADIIVMCGVHFMGETAKILCPEKKVLIPDPEAGCSLADSCPAHEFEEFVKAHPDHKLCEHFGGGEGAYGHRGDQRQRPQGSGLPACR